MYCKTHFEHASPSGDTRHDSLPSRLRYQVPANLKTSHTHNSQIDQIPREKDVIQKRSEGLATRPDNTRDPEQDSVSNIKEFTSDTPLSTIASKLPLVHQRSKPTNYREVSNFSDK